jgi:hypothetical protein
MKTEFVLFGKRINMASRSRRRWLVVLVYAGFAALMAAFWSLDHWRLSCVCIFIAALAVNRRLFGGYASGGLVRRFGGNQMLWRYDKPPQSRIGKLITPSEPDLRDYQNDEREIRLCDRAHYHAY